MMNIKQNKVLLHVLNRRSNRKLYWSFSYAALSVIMSACTWNTAVGGGNESAQITPYDTKLTGNNLGNITGFYGRYRLVEGSLGPGVTLLEITPSQYGRPVFAFLNDNGVAIQKSSPHACVVEKGSASLDGMIGCGEIAYLQTGPYIRLNSPARMEGRGPDEYFGIANGAIVPFKRNWYSFAVKWSGHGRTYDSVLAKLN